VTAGASLGAAPRRNAEPSVCPDYPRSPCPEGAQLGWYATRSLEFALTGGGRRTEYAFAASRFETDGAYAFNNDYDNRTLSGRVRVAAGARSEIAAAARYTDGTFHFPTDGAGRLADRNQFRAVESFAWSVEAAHSFTARLETKLALSSHDGDQATEDRPDGPADTLGFYASLSESSIVRRKADLHANLRFGAASILTLGAEAEAQEGATAFASRSSFGPFESASDHERSNRAGYAQFVTRAGALTVTAGARAENNDRFGTFRTWRAGGNLRVPGDLLVRVAAGAAFKEPTFFENYAQGFVTGNPALRPEEARSVEIGVEKNWLTAGITLGATWFDQRFTNLIQFVSRPAQPEAPNYVNVGEAASAGLELEIRAGSPGRRTLDASWTRLVTRVLDEGTGEDRLFQHGERLIRRPKHRLVLSAGAPLGARLNASATIVHVGARDDLDFLDDFNGARVVLPAYTTVDLTVRARMFARPDLSADFRIDNLFAADYREIANFPARGRTITVAITAGMTMGRR
jgi:vitamin B12 transporter